MLTRASLPLRNLRHFGTANVLIVAGVIVGTAVLTGALLLGDSLKGSLASLTLDRLGQIDAALVSERFFPASLSTRISAAAPAVGRVTPAVVLRGTVLRRSADGSQVLSRAGQVQIVGVEPGFWPMFGEAREIRSDEVVINQALAAALQLGAQDGVEVRVEAPQRVPAESVLGRRSDAPALVIETSRVAAILPNRGAGRFTLLPRQEEPLILYVQLERLQRRLTRDQQLPAGSVNVLLADLQNRVDAAELNQALRKEATFEDLGFTLRRSGVSSYVLETSRMVLESNVVQAVQEGLGADFKITPVLTYLANRTYRVDQSDAPRINFVPYSAIAGLSQVNDIPLAEDEVVINEYVGKDLWPAGNWQASLGKPVVRIEYFVETEGHRLKEATHDLKLKAVVAMQGLAADRTLTPELPGMKTNRIADWNPPFPRDQWHPEWVRPRDEEYYRQYRATPKLFVHPKTAAKLFGSRFGQYTSLRFQPKVRGGYQEKVREQLSAALRLEDFGLTWQSVKQQGLQAATQGGTTNMFGGLFAGFSLFLIVAAALLVGLLFRLRTERRAREIGLLLATGWPVAKVRRLLLTEGAVLALLGALLGLPAAIGYAWLMIQGLRAGWGGLLASDSLGLHVSATSLVAGAVGSMVIALVAIVWSLRGLVRQPAPVLLAGRSTLPVFARPTRAWVNWLPIVTGLMTLGLIGFGVTLPAAQKPGPFFGAGFLALLTLVLIVRARLRRRAQQGQTLVTRSTLWQLGRLNTARSPGRSLLTLTLLAAGCFMVVAVGAFRKGAEDPDDPTSGTGGFALLAEADVPLRAVPRGPGGWELLLEGASPEQQEEAKKLGDLRWHGLRLRSGEDVSCLNLYQPTRPRVLGIPREVFDLPRFTVQVWEGARATVKASPWDALYATSSDAVPVFLDDHTAQWVLQKKLGDLIDLVDETGASHPGRLVGMVQGSIFQSEMLISEDHFRRLYPSEAGYRFFLIAARANQVSTVRTSLENVLGESHGLVVRTTASRLAAYHAVENTYIGTFQALGGLGLLLGTAGLAIVILRNVQERQAELALLQAIGFSRRQVATTLLVEVGWIVLLGVAIGCGSALLVVAPLLTGETITRLIQWLVLVAVLVPLVGWLSSLAGIRLALRTPLIPALRGE
jgi:ABC-type lipoprotein release transport system permease subunit